MSSDADDIARQIEAVRKVLGEPVMCEFSTTVLKTRTTLFVISIISISVVLLDLKIDPTSTVLGIRFQGIDDGMIHTALFWIVLYLVLHFFWSSWDALMEWRLRVTGTRTAFVTTGRSASADGDYPSDPRQSTLYHWWSDYPGHIQPTSKMLAELKASLLAWEAKLGDAVASLGTAVGTMNVAHAAVDIRFVREYIEKVERHLGTVEELLKSRRPEVSLRRFDRLFELFLRSQNLRWLLLDFLTPICLGMAALWLLSAR